MSNNLADTARRAYQKRRVYVPSWMQVAQVVAVAVIPVVVVVSLVMDRNDPIPTQQPVVAGSPVIGGSSDDATGASADQGSVSTPQGSGGPSTRLQRTTGGSVRVPEAALETARLAGLALWTGNWEEVPVSGTAPVTDAVFPNASLGQPTVYSRTDDAVVFVFPLDTDGDGDDDQTFQISVVSEDGAWVFPSVAG